MTVAAEIPVTNIETTAWEPFLVNGQWPVLRVHPDLGGTLPREDGGGSDPVLPTDG